MCYIAPCDWFDSDNIFAGAFGTVVEGFYVKVQAGNPQVLRLAVKSIKGGCTIFYCKTILFSS